MGVEIKEKEPPQIHRGFSSDTPVESHILRTLQGHGRMFPQLY